MVQLRAGAQQGDREGEGGAQQALEYAHARGETDKVAQLVLRELGTKLRQGDLQGAAALLAKYGAPVKAEGVEMYRALAREVLQGSSRNVQAESNLRKVGLGGGSSSIHHAVCATR